MRMLIGGLIWLKGWFVQMGWQLIIKYLLGRMTKKVLVEAVKAGKEAAAKTKNPIDDVCFYVAGVLVEALPGSNE